MERLLQVPNRISGEFWEDLSYRLPFTLNISNIFGRLWEGIKG